MRDNARMVAQAHHRRALNGLIPPTGPETDTSKSAAAAVTTPTSTSTTTTSTATSSVVTTPSSTSAAPTTSTASVATTSSSTVASTSSATSVSAAPTSAAPTSIAAKPTTAAVASTPATRTYASLTYGATHSTTATAAADSSGGPSVGAIIGIVGGGLVGVVILAAVLGYGFRYVTRKKNNDFDRGDFVRNSVVLPDSYGEKVPMGTKNALALAKANAFMDEPSATPRPPTMIERRQGPGGPRPGEYMNAPAPAAGYYDQNAYYNNYNAGYDPNYGYNQTGQYDPAQYGAAAAVGYTPPDEHQQTQLTRKPSAPLGPNAGYEQQRNPGDMTATTMSPEEQYYRHQSVTPYQQQQYNEITRQLQGGADAAGPQQHQGPPAEGTNLGRSLSTAYSSLNPQQPAKSYSEPERGNRSGTPTDPNPQQTYYAPNEAAAASQNAQAHTTPAAGNRHSVFDEEDAYGGI